jgi:hypothetical protein
VEAKDQDRLSAKLYAIDFRVAELDYELQRTKVRVLQLEAQLEDAKLAQLMGGEAAGNPAEIGLELERSRGSLDTQQELLVQVKQSQWKTRVHLTALKAKARMDQRQLEEAE